MGKKLTSKTVCKLHRLAKCLSVITGEKVTWCSFMIENKKYFAFTMKYVDYGQSGCTVINEAFREFIKSYNADKQAGYL